MRLAIDASSAVLGGGVTYLRHLMPLLVEEPDVDVVAVLIRDEARKRAGLDHVDLPFMSARGRAGAAAPTWRRSVAASRAEVVLAPTEISFASYRCPLVLAVRNPMLGTKIAEFPAYLRRRIVLQTALAKRSARKSAAHVAVSHEAARLAYTTLGVPPDRVHVVHHGGPPMVRPPRPLAPCRRFLYVSHFHPWKNHRRLLEAFAGVEGEWTLDIVGEGPEGYVAELRALADSLGLSSRVKFRGHLSSDAVAEAYEQAECFVWPSYLETFGHPLLEAHAHGLPIIAASASVNEEIAGAAACYFDPFDVAALRGLLERAMAEGITTGPLPRSYSWPACAQGTIAALRSVID